MENIIKYITKKEVYGLLLIIIISFILYKIFNYIIDKIFIKNKNNIDKKKKNTLIALLKNIGKYTIIILGIFFILDLYGVNTGSLIASIGVASAVIALALQDTLKDVISGTAIIMDNYFAVGDIVKYNNFTGTVIQFGLKSTKIMNFDGQVLTVSNRNINEIINLTDKVASPLVVIPTAYEEDIEKVEKVLNKIVEEIKTWPDVDQEKTRYLGVLELAESSVNYGIRIYCKPEKQWRYKWDALRLVKLTYDKNNIKIPYNQIEVHNANAR